MNKKYENNEDYKTINYQIKREKDEEYILWC